MKFIYPAVFHKTEEGHYKGYFPDLDIEDIEVKEGEIVRNISMNIRFYEGWDE